MGKKIVITEQLKSVLDQVNYNWISDVLKNDDIEEEHLVGENHIDYLDLSHTNKGHLSYLTRDRINKIDADDKDYWRVKMRYHGKPGSVIKKLLNADRCIVEDFAVKFLAVVDKPEHHFEIVKGEDITKYYSHATYYNQYGSLGGSCMKYSPPEFFEIYAKNPEHINMLVMMDQHGKIMGRSLLWVGEGFRILDRIYVNSEGYINYFQNWAKENGVFYKQQNNWSTPTLYFDPNSGDKVIKELSIQLNKDIEYERYPYMDTFKWVDFKNMIAYNHLPKDVTNVKALSHAGGYFYEGNIFGIDEMTNIYYSSGDIVNIDYLNINVFCGNACHSRLLNKFILKEHSIYLKEISDYIYNAEYDHLNDYVKIDKEKMLRKAKFDDPKYKVFDTDGGNYWERPWEPIAGAVGHHPIAVDPVIDIIPRELETAVSSGWPESIDFDDIAETTCASTTNGRIYPVGAIRRAVSEMSNEVERHSIGVSGQIDNDWGDLPHP